MNRRGFLKSIVAVAVGATLPMRSQAETFIGVDPAAGEDHSAVMRSGEIGEYEGFRFIETTNTKSVGQTWDIDGGYILTQQQEDELLKQMHPATKFNYFVALETSGHES